MPDATVFSGGGGLCGEDCPFNHFDGQVRRVSLFAVGVGRVTINDVSVLLPFS